MVGSFSTSVKLLYDLKLKSTYLKKFESSFCNGLVFSDSHIGKSGVVADMRSIAISMHS
jgi:hypothetical protein